MKLPPYAKGTSGEGLVHGAWHSVCKWTPTDLTFSNECYGFMFIAEQQVWPSVLAS